MSVVLSKNETPIFSSLRLRWKMHGNTERSVLQLVTHSLADVKVTPSLPLPTSSSSLPPPPKTEITWLPSRYLRIL